LCDIPDVILFTIQSAMWPRIYLFSGVRTPNPNIRAVHATDCAITAIDAFIIIGLLRMTQSARLFRLSFS